MRIFDEDVNGIIIGDVTFPYEFWIYEKLHPSLPEHKEFYVNRKIARMSFCNDEEAVTWFKENYPNEYKYGVEMRVFDKNFTTL